MLSHVLLHFVVRLAFGLSAAMAITSAGQVTAGFFRVHLWVTLGLNTFAALALKSSAPQVQQAFQGTFALVVAAAVVSYVGSVAWLYQRRGWGRILLVLVCLLDGLAAYRLTSPGDALANLAPAAHWAQAGQVVLASLLLGFALTAMLLGHWYLNTPSMQLAPLRRLLVGLFVIAVLRGVSEASGLAAALSHMAPGNQGMMVALRWLSGIVGTLVLTVMAWLTLRIPNTQSATGILYVVVIFVFLGELGSFWLATTYGNHS